MGSATIECEGRAGDGTPFVPISISDVDPLADPFDDKSLASLVPEIEDWDGEVDGCDRLAG